MAPEYTNGSPPGVPPSQPLAEEAADRLARRPWPAHRMRTDLEVSFEFFPPGSSAAAQSLDDCVDVLHSLEPEFVSVTYGAGGTTQERTLDAVRKLVERTSLSVAGHLTCVGATSESVHRVLDTYRESGVRRIVALRGDPPAGLDDGAVEGGYRSARDLVAAIRSRPDGADFDISVAAYPEVHPKATSAQADLDNLKRKIDAGADRAITQFFFDTDAFLRFHDTARKQGITVPIVPGIMPVTNFEKMAGFAERCGTTVPDWMYDLFGGLQEADDIQQLVAATVAAEQCRRLAEHGIRHFHFYTMNRPQLTAATCRILGVRPSGRNAARTELAS